MVARRNEVFFGAARFVEQEGGECHEGGVTFDPTSRTRPFMEHTLQVIIEHDKDGYFAFVPELKGCHSQGDSLDEVMKNMNEAIDLYVSTLRPAEVKRLM
jgi:predicted RNase H-like HicB family nuclease